MKTLLNFFRQLVENFVLYKLHSFYSAMKSDQAGRPLV